MPLRRSTVRAAVARAATLLAVLACTSCERNGASTGAPTAAAAAAEGDADADAQDAPAAEVTAPPLDEPVDLARWCRLTASGTRDQVLWPREAEWGIATIRDDHDHTAWQAPADESTTVVLDCQPWVQAPVALDAIEVGFADGQPVPFSVTTRVGCGGDVVATADGTGEDPVVLGSARAGCIEIAFGESSDLRVGRIAIWSRDGLALPPAPPSPAVSGDLLPPSGAVEGFYGVPWSWREREAVVRSLALDGLGAYLYAPKWDPLHRAAWREPYPEAFVDQLGGLAAKGESWGIRVFFGLSPFIDFAAESDADLVVAKAVRFVRAGVTGVALLADDIEFESDRPIDAAMAAEHVALANRTLAAAAEIDPDVAIWFVPTVYSDERLDQWRTAEEYVSGLGELDPAIAVLWTGPATSNASIAPGDLERVEALLGRRVLVWDNFWANDGGDGLDGRILMGGFTGRPPDLGEAVAGIVQNPAIQGAVARFDVAMFGAHAAAGETDVSTQRRHAAERETEFAIRADDETVALVEMLAGVFDGDALSGPGFIDLDSTVAEAVAQLTAGAPIDIDALLDRFSEMATLQSRVHHSALDPDLVDDLWFPLERIRIEGEAGLWSVLELIARSSGVDPAPFAAEVDARIVAASRNRFVVSAGVVPGWIAAVRATGEGAVPVAVGGPLHPPSECAVGMPLFAGFVLTGTAIRVAGLGPVGGLGAASRPAPHAGVYRVAVTRWEPADDSRRLHWYWGDVVCE